MRILAIILILAAFPAFVALLRSKAHRKWAFVALGALPLLYAPLNVDVSLISWPMWPGHNRGLTVTIVDPLALAICLRYGRTQAPPPLWWAFTIYLVCLLPGLFSGAFTPALFFFFQALRVTLLFYAVYLAVLNGQLLRIVEGLAIAVIASGAVSVYHGLSGAIQAQGILGHQNLSGLSTNLGVPLLLALGLTAKRRLFLLAVAVAAMGAIAGGSRGTIIFLGVSLAGTIAAVVLVKPSGRTVAIATVAALGLVAAAPFAIQKLTERGAGFEKDPERVAFERTAELMIDDYPWGVGLNHYVSVANLGGYFDKAGVRWGYEARSTSVHNTYLLMRTEAGLLGLAGLLIWLLSPILLAATALFRRHMALREVSIASGIAITGAAIHSLYEWITVTATPQYLIAIMAGIIAALAAHGTRLKRRNLSRRLANPTGDPRLPSREAPSHSHSGHSL
jgi:O-antigen ligase